MIEGDELIGFGNMEGFFKKPYGPYYLLSLLTRHYPFLMAFELNSPTLPPIEFLGVVTVPLSSLFLIDNYLIVALKMAEDALSYRFRGSMTSFKILSYVMGISLSSFLIRSLYIFDK